MSNELTRYLVKVGDDAQPAFRMESKGEVRLFLTGLLVGDGKGVERGAALADTVADHLAQDGQYPDNEATRLRDGRPVYVWREG